MIINLAIDCQNNIAIGTVKGLTARLWIDNAQALMGKDGRATTVDATPVGATVADLLTHLQGFLTQFMRLLLNIQYCYYSTHNFSFFYFFIISFFVFHSFIFLKVREIEVIGLGGVFGSKGVDLIDGGDNAQFLAPGAHHQTCFGHAHT